MQYVHINRLGVNSVEFDYEIVDIPMNPGDEQSFEIVLINYGSPTHVHLSVDPSIEENVSILEEKPYVTHEEYVPVVVRIPAEGRLMNTGTINVTMGYGSKTEGFQVNIGTASFDERYDYEDEDEDLDEVHGDSISSIATKKNKGTKSKHFSGISVSFLNQFDLNYLKAFFIFVIVSVFLIVLYLVYQTSFESGTLALFYLAVVLAIAFTSLMSYILIKLL
ncbi:DUF7524 family protein [Methanosalsum natronophilum]|nr:hypothetical protein [Methanosalsum natronophilum]MCS3923188.1 hypothetical protein [Methanosalsum natronophilum]